MALADSPPKPAPGQAGRFLGKFSRSFIVLLLFLGSAWLVQRFIFNRALALSLQAAAQISDSLPEPSSAESPDTGYFFPLFPFSSEQLAGSSSSASAEGAENNQQQLADPRLAPGSAIVAPKKGSLPARPGEPASDLNGPPPWGPKPQNARADRARVLAWANGQLVPQGRAAQASFGMPAGIELFQVGALGVGVMDRDRLIAVDGGAVTTRGEVVAAVLGARGREQEAIVATLVRNTESGPLKFQVIIEQPYLTEEEIHEMLAPKASD